MREKAIVRIGEKWKRVEFETKGKQNIFSFLLEL
jgi:hypothetical protein